MTENYLTLFKKHTELIAESVDLEILPFFKCCGIAVHHWSGKLFLVKAGCYGKQLPQVMMNQHRNQLNFLWYFTFPELFLKLIEEVLNPTRTMQKTGWELILKPAVFSNQLFSCTCTYSLYSFCLFCRNCLGWAISHKEIWLVLLLRLIAGWPPSMVWN